MMEQTQLLAGTSVTDITPPLEVGLLTSSVKGSYEPFESVRLPLKARVLVLGTLKDLVAIVSLDLLALNDTATGGWQHFKEGLSGVIPPERIIITCTHTHNGPESVALSGLYKTPVYKKWLADVQHKVKEAILKAAVAARPCHASFAVGVLEGYTLLRRIPTPEGVIMSDAVQPIAPELMNRQPVDRRVHSVAFRDQHGDTIATLVHAVCHPVHEMLLPHISAEFPGEMCLALEASGEHGMPIFLNGAAGEINPPTVSCGPAYAQRHGRALAELVQQQERSSCEEAFSHAHSEMQFPVRPEAGMTQADALARFSAIRIGSLAMVFIPGEPFTATAFAIERGSPFAHTIVAAYAENTIGYIPTAAAFAEGGYETGPGKWSYLAENADTLITTEALRLLTTLNNSSR
ncbi:hypothetical protein [Chitinophaga cymbidii]|uniref:Neutral/alkaline non-lysosomal ceramidase N-terminal domain-containing protein n=1 Tax=Chitinophaga cymbidii TaxID=1096750 RepID=A0A512RRZ6_9BACT|nr:hypothetical protein [Chitinophaga cymbidii]GEP98465.1 hypothetical protein CCY01nite_47250 [Chitinophaga cymbidii]